MKKYVCMKDECDFCTSDEEDAFEHAHMRKRHEVVEIDMNNGEEPTCHRLMIPEVGEIGYEEEES